MTAVWVTLVVGLSAVLMLTVHRLGQARDRRARVDARLTAVLEGTAAGLSVWDREGGLVGCNQRFREYYPDAPLEPGVVFEDLIRYTANRAVVRLVDDRDETIDAWVAERLERFGEAHHEVLRTADGRWLDVFTGTTEAGEIMMLYADTTDTRTAEVTRSVASEQRDQRTADVGMLADVIQAARVTSTTDAAIDRVCECVGIGASFAVGHAYRTAPDGQSLDPMAVWYSASAPGGEAASYGDLQSLVQASHPRRGDGLAGRVLHSGRLVWVPNVAVDPTVDDDLRAVLEDIQGACGVPVYGESSDERVVAVLVFYATRPLSPDSAMERLLEAVATTVGWIFTSQNAR